MQQKKLLLIVNPRSGRKRYNDDMLEVGKVLGAGGYHVTVLNTGAHGDATDYARRFASDYDVVACRGGDGTFCEVLTGIMSLERKPPVGFIPAGTTNDLAATLRLPMTPHKAAQLIVDEQPRECDIGSINGRFFTYVASFGALTECSYAAPQSLKNKIGRFAYFYEAAKEIKDIHPIPIRAVIDGEVIEDDFVFGSISNSYTVGKVIHLRKNEVNLNDGKYEVLLAKNPGSVKGWSDMLTSVIKKDFDERYIKYCHASEIRIETRDGSPLPWTLDGEYGGDDSVSDIKILNNAFTMFRPAFEHEIIDEGEESEQQETQAAE